MKAGEKILSKLIGVDGAWELKAAKKAGRYKALRKALKMTPEEVKAEVKEAGLRGRGGAGFPAGVKWGFLPPESFPRYLVINADESEPGTFKDRALMEWDPHQLLEGCLIAAYAIEAEAVYIYIRGEMPLGFERLEQAIAEARKGGLIGKKICKKDFHCEIYMHRGAGAYICGEETALLTSLEGNRGYPRLKPPFPAVKGAFGKPTIVNNVETICNVPHIIERGADWFKSIGPEGSAGPKLLCVSGHVKRRGLYEKPMGYSLERLIYEDCGGIAGDRQLKAVVPGGSSVPVLRADEIDVGLDYDSLAAIGSLLGSAGIIVMDETTCMVDALYNLMRFYHHESCGQCTPCREGTGWVTKLLARIENGEGHLGDVETFFDVSKQMFGAFPEGEDFKTRFVFGKWGMTICPLADAAVMPARTYVEKFREEFDAHVAQKGCPLRTGAAV